MKPQKFFYKLLDILTVLCLLVFFASFGFKDSKSGGWYQQWFPNMNGSTISSLTFLDSLTGFGVTSINSDTLCYILKTTNGGDNWSIKYSYHPPYANISFNKIQFLNNTTGYASAEYTSLFKTTNGGDNWYTIYTGLYPQDMAVLNKDTILFVYSSGLSGGVYRTTNGGLNWQPLGTTGGSGQPYRIYMFNKDLGFNLGSELKKTTNGGVNWFVVTGGAFLGMQFIDSLTGWKCNGDIKKTTDGGLNWISQQLPQNIQFISNGISSNSLVNINNQWGVGGTILLNNKLYGLIYKTTNGGVNWGYQLTDTSIHIGHFDYIKFISSMTGWAYTNSGIHTKNGGSDTTFYTWVNNNTTTISKDYILFQNYPNPFNPSTNIKYQITNSKYITIKIYDINGREIITLVNKKQNAGNYEVEFNASNLTSGIYFYTLFVDGIRIDTKKAILIK
jgi:photosystem II stability/assembly factor-like uncharacterized protein